MEYFKHKYVEDENMSRQIKIDGQGSDWYESAVFIVRENVGKKAMPSNVVHYAEDLIERHMKLGAVENVSKKKAYSWIDTCFWISIGMLAITCAIYFCI